MWTVYKHTTPENKVYIGITRTSVEKRWGLYGRGYIRQTKFFQAILRFGWDNILHEILEQNIKTEKEARELETYYINFYNSIKNGYNNYSSYKSKRQPTPRSLAIINVEPLYQIDPETGQIIETFPSIKAAAQKLGYNLRSFRSNTLKTNYRYKTFIGA